MSKQVKFRAEPHHQVGDVMRMMVGGFKFWRVVKVENGWAFAKPVSGPSEGAC